MKKRSQVPCDEALLINVSGDRPIDHLDGRTLDRHLENIFLFKLGLLNSFGIDFRSHAYSRMEPDGSARTVLFNYLSELPPLIEGRVNQFPKERRAAYAKLEDAAIASFWEVYYRFQPLIHRYSRQYDVDVDDLGNVLGRALLLYEKGRGFKFYTYLEKTLRESVKNLRGKIYADEFCLPLSAGRLMPQLFWLLDQETLRLERRLSPDESEQLVIRFMREHSAHFSESTMRAVAHAARTGRRRVSLDRDVTLEDRGPAERTGLTDGDPQNSVETMDEYEDTLRRIHVAIEKAGFDRREQAIVLERLDLTHDEDLYARIESELSAGSLRNRKMRLLVRFKSALHSSDAPRTGRFLNAQPEASRGILRRALEELADDHRVTTEEFIQRLMNLMSLTESIYRLSINERGRLEKYLERSLGDSPAAKSLGIDGHVFNKLKAALMEQESQGFPFLK